MAERDIAYETLLSAIRSRTLHRLVKIFGSIGLVLFGSCYLLEGPPFYYSDPIHIRVVDEETQKPVTGAVALACWNGRGDFGDSHYLHVAEAVSNQSGWLTLPGWWLIRPPLYRMTFQDPLIRIYKPGGYAGTADNDGAHQFGYQSSDPRRIKRIAFWDGKTVPLVRLRTPIDEANAISSLISATDGARQVGPVRYPSTWNAIASGYSHLPKVHREPLGNPIDRIRSFQK